MVLINCPECHHKLHEGQHTFADGIFLVKYCKKCGLKEERPKPNEDTN